MRLAGNNAAAALTWYADAAYYKGKRRAWRIAAAREYERRAYAAWRACK